MPRAGSDSVRTFAVPAIIGIVAAVVWVGPATPNEWFVHGHAGPLGLDLQAYLNYANQTFDGGQPYRDFAVEYPPLSMIPMLAARLFGDEAPAYREAFAAISGLLVVGAALATTFAARARRLGWQAELTAGGLIALGPVLLGGGLFAERLDVLPMALVSLAVFAAARGRYPASGLMAGFGAAAKLWPAVALVPLAALASRSGRPALRGTSVGFALGLAIPFAIVLVISPDGLVDTVRYHLDRPLQVEAVRATGLIALDHLGLAGPYGVEGSFGSANLTGGASIGATGSVTAILGVAALVAISALGWIRTRAAETEAEAFELAMRTALAGVVALLVFGKVFSLQFVIWLLPLPLFIGRGRWLAAGLVALVALLTHVVAARYLDYALGFDQGLTAILLARGLLLIGLLVMLIVPLLPATRTAWHPAVGAPRADARARPGSASAASAARRAS